MNETRWTLEIRRTEDFFVSQPRDYGCGVPENQGFIIDHKHAAEFFVLGHNH